MGVVVFICIRWMKKNKGAFTLDVMHSVAAHGTAHRHIHTVCQQVCCIAMQCAMAPRPV